MRAKPAKKSSKSFQTLINEAASSIKLAIQSKQFVSAPDKFFVSSQVAKNWVTKQNTQTLKHIAEGLII